MTLWLEIWARSEFMGLEMKSFSGMFPKFLQFLQERSSYSIGTLYQVIIVYTPCCWSEMHCLPIMNIRTHSGLTSTCSRVGEWSGLHNFSLKVGGITLLCMLKTSLQIENQESRTRAGLEPICREHSKVITLLCGQKYNLPPHSQLYSAASINLSLSTY